MAKDKEFFNKVSANCNYIDPVLAKDVYYAIIRTVLQELRAKEEINMPEFGTFRVTEHKSHKILNKSTGQQAIVPAKKTIKFSAFYKLKHYVHNKI
jgi:nucleoid DNA-binding protein